jgi:hypothetical protein
MVANGPQQDTLTGNTTFRRHGDLSIVRSMKPSSITGDARDLPGLTSRCLISANGTLSVSVTQKIMRPE